MSTLRSTDQIVAAAQGDDEALALLVHAYHDRVYRFGRKVCRDGFDADDAVQEAFVELAARPDVTKSPGALSWLMSVVRNTCLRVLRPFVRERRTLGERIDDDVDITSDVLDAQQALERWELVRSVHAAIANLERPHREVLVMRDLEELTGEETCAALGLEVVTMETRLLRARGKLRDALAKHRKLQQNKELN